MQFSRPVAQFGRASVSKTEGWGFDSLLACFESGKPDMKLADSFFV